MIHFITGNKHKVDEAKLVIPDLEQMDLDLPEIQSLDSKEIIKFKLETALAHHKGEFIVEDTGFYIKKLNGLPGPLVKWFLKTVGSEGIYKIARTFGQFEVEVKCVIGYASSRDDVHFFEGVIQGLVVPPTGDKTTFGFGWDPIFRPEGSTKTFAEMTPHEKIIISHRGKAVRELKKFLNQRESR